MNQAHLGEYIAFIQRAENLKTPFVAHIRQMADRKAQLNILGGFVCS